MSAPFHQTGENRAAKKRKILKLSVFAPIITKRHECGPFKGIYLSRGGKRSEVQNSSGKGIATMRSRKKICLLTAFIFAMSLSFSVVFAQNQNQDQSQNQNNNSVDLKPAQNMVNQIRQSDLPQVSTTTKPNPVGQKSSDYKPPAASTLKVKEPPPPQK